LESRGAFKNVPWGSLLMCAATLILGVALTSDSIGIKAFLQNNLSSNLVNVDGFILLFVFILWAGLQTNVSSNMVTATLVATVASSVLSNISSSLEITPIICLIGFMASLAFATPPSMPHIAIIAGSEYCTTKDVLIYGGILTIVSVILFVFIAYPYGIVLF
jgi:sodium-dependent dicarboxylate transporter 2/3/5